MPTPPPPAAGAEVDTFTITNATVPNDGKTKIAVDTFADKNNANDVTIVNASTDPITELTIEKFGDNDGQQDVIRIDLSQFDEDFTLFLKNTGNTVSDKLFLQGIDSFVDNKDGTFTVTYTGTDTLTHTVTVVAEDPTVTEVVPYYTSNGVVDGADGAEVMGVGYTDARDDDAITNGDDSIVGDGGSDTISGGDGNDTIMGDFSTLIEMLAHTMPEFAYTGTPPGPAAGAEVDSFQINDANIDANGKVTVEVDTFATKGNANDVTIVHGGTEDITQIDVKKFGDGDGQADVIRFDLSTYDDDFLVVIANEDAPDTILFEGVHDAFDNGDGTWDVTYFGTDSVLHTVTVNPDTAQVAFYLADTSPYFYDDEIDGGDGDDLIDGGAGADSILGGSGADTIDGGDGSDTIDGGTGDDSIIGDRTAQLQSLTETMAYSYAQTVTGDQAAHFGEQGTGAADDPNLLFDGDEATEARYHDSDIIEYSFGQTLTAGTSITLTDGAGIEDALVEVYVSNGTTDPNGDALSGSGGGVGYENAVTNGQSTLIYSGPADGTVHLEMPIDATHIQFVALGSHAGWAEIELTELVSPPSPGADLITGGAGNDTIDGGMGDDSIDAGADNDSVIGGEGDDTILGQGGMDTITGDAGDDSIDAGTEADDVDGGIGHDTIIGGDGNDTLYGGDSEPDVPLERVAFEWSAIPDPDDGGQIDNLDAITSGSQTIGGIDVTFSVTGGAGQYETTTVYTSGIDAGAGSVDTNSALGLDGSNGVLTMDFSTPVENLQFNINDFEANSETINIKAYDAQGNLIPFSVVEGSGVNGSDTDTIAGNDTFQGPLSNTGDNSSVGSIGVTIPGPVAQLVIDYTQTNGSLTMTDVWFDDPATGIDGGGNDSIDAGDGDDVIVAGTGADTIAGGAGTDTYDASASPDLVNETITVSVDGNGNGTVAKLLDGTTDSITGMESFIAGEDENEDDEITLTAPVTAFEVSGMDNSAVGFFTSDDTGQSYFFGGVGEPTINDILTRSYDPGTGILAPQGTYTITGGEENGAQIGNFYVENFENINFDVVCFARGTHVETDRGEVRIEDLKAGDLVQTLDHGLQPIRWIGSTATAALGKNAPIEIRKGALGNHRDLRVSQQHRMLLTGWQLELLFGDGEALVPAKSLVNDHSIRRVPGGVVEYFHMLFDTHQIVFAEGAPSESFHPGAVGMATLTDTAIGEIHGLFPALQDDVDAYGPSARTSLKRFEAKVLCGMGGLTN